MNLQKLTLSNVHEASIYDTSFHFSSNRDNLEYIPIEKLKNYRDILQIQGAELKKLGKAHFKNKFLELIAKVIIFFTGRFSDIGRNLLANTKLKEIKLKKDIETLKKNTRQKIEKLYSQPKKEYDEEKFISEFSKVPHQINLDINRQTTIQVVTKKGKVQSFSSQIIEKLSKKEIALCDDDKNNGKISYGEVICRFIIKELIDEPVGELTEKSIDDLLNEDIEGLINKLSPENKKMLYKIFIDYLHQGLFGAPFYFHHKLKDVNTPEITKTLFQSTKKPSQRILIFDTNNPHLIEGSDKFELKYNENPNLREIRIKYNVKTNQIELDSFPITPEPAILENKPIDPPIWL